MDVFSHTELGHLTNVNSGPCVSLYIPTHLTGPEAPQDTIRLKNLVRTAETKLSNHWMRPADARKMLRDAAALPEREEFWSKRNRGLAVFVSRDSMRTYRLPVPFLESVSVSHRFRVRRLLPALDNHRHFYILALSQNDCGLYSATPRSMELMEVAGLPRNMDDALNLDQADRGAQVHSASHGMFGKQAGVFHGQGGKPDRIKTDLEAFARQVNKAVVEKLGDATEPLVLAAVDSVCALYRRVNTYRHLLKQAVAGNHDDRKATHILERAWPIARTHFEQQRVQAAARYQDAINSAKTTDDVRTVLSAAVTGRIDVLFHDPAACVYGTFASTVDNVEITGNGDDDDLVDLAVVETLRHRGTVYSMDDQELSTNSPLATILRY